LAKYPPYPKDKVYHEKEKNSNSIHRNESGASITHCYT